LYRLKVVEFYRQGLSKVIKWQIVDEKGNVIHEQIDTYGLDVHHEKIKFETRNMARMILERLKRKEYKTWEEEIG